VYNNKTNIKIINKKALAKTNKNAQIAKSAEYGVKKNIKKLRKK
jgi:hypothetical protein